MRHPTPMRLLAVLPLAAALLLGPTMSTSAFAAGKTTGTAASAKGGAKAGPGKTKRKPAPVRFTAVGQLTAVDSTAGTATVTVKAGMKDLRGKTLVVAVPSSARIVLNDVVVPLGSLPAGARVTVVGTRTGDAFTASKLIGTAPSTPA